MAESIIYRQTVTLPAGSFSVNVTLNYGFTDVNYGVKCIFQYEAHWWITNKTASGFTINVGTNNMNDQPIEVIVQHN